MSRNLHICIYIYIYTYIYRHACMHAYIHTYIHECIHTEIRRWMGLFVWDALSTILNSPGLFIDHSELFIHHSRLIIEGSFEVKLPTIWTDEKQSWAEAERREE